MVAVAVVGVVVSVVGGVLGWHLVGQLDRTTRETLDVTLESLESLADTIDVAGDVLGSTTHTLTAAGATLDTVITSFEAADAVVGEVAALAATAAPALSEAVAVLRRLETIGTSIDEMLAALSSLPLAPDYSPDQPFGPAVGDLADTLEPVAVDFTDASTELATLAGELDGLRESIGELDAAVTAVGAGLAGTDELLGEYRAQIDEARHLAERTRADLGGDTTWMRLLIVAGAVNFMVGQIVPLWFGHELLARSREASVS